MSMAAGCDSGGDPANPDVPADAGTNPPGGDAGQSDAGNSDARTGPGPDGAMSFFVTSSGNGANGGNFGGLAGADARCQTFAEAAGATGRTWSAYLSTDDLEIGPVVDARDRIGQGPWYNAAGELVAADLDSLHQDGIVPSLMLDENGATIPRNEHDLLTGSKADGTVTQWDNTGRLVIATCRNWTSGDRADFAWVGHADDADWNNSHESRCSEDGMRNVNGAGRLMCFAID